jgi:hypothetical protein
LVIRLAVATPIATSGPAPPRASLPCGLGHAPLRGLAEDVLHDLTASAQPGRLLPVGHHHAGGRTAQRGAPVLKARLPAAALARGLAAQAVVRERRRLARE